MEKAMRLSLKIGVIFILLSAILYGFSHRYSPSNTVPQKPITAKPIAPAATKFAIMPREVNESSGLELGDEPGTFFTHNDAGNAPKIYKVDRTGKLLAAISIPGAENIDWEDITRDNAGNIYIGDVGNNSNKRKKFKIYKFNLKTPDEVSEIIFEYADRKAGTVEKKHFEFDCEALFWYNAHLYLVTKDRGTGVNARLYQITDSPGEQEAQPLSYYDVYAPVTAADISPDGENVLLLSEGNLHLFPVTNSSDFFQSATMKTIPLGKVGQTEGAVFADNKTVIICNEDGELFEYKL